MKFIDTEFKDLYVIEPKGHTDNRGWFMRLYDSQIFEDYIPNFSGNWKQMNQSHNIKKGTFRGLHYQKPPFQETKLIRCISGAVIDYALDLREGSDTFLKVFQLELSAENKKMLILPRGFAHGFFTLEDNSDLLYFHDEFYNSKFDAGIYFQDPIIKDHINILPEIISDKDRKHEHLSIEFNGI